MKIRYLFFLLFIFVFSEATPQSGSFKQRSVQNGLPQSDVHCLLQDSRGYVWVGTSNGVSMFDGKSFITYSKSNGLSGSTVRSILQDNLGRMWFATESGITVFNGRKFILIDKHDGLKGSTVLSLLQDHQNNILAGTDDGGINKIVSLGVDSFNVSNINHENGLSDSPVFDLFEDNNNNVWAATLGGGINILKPVNQDYEISKIDVAAGIPSDLIIRITPDNDGNVWVGSYDAGAFRLSLNDVSKKTVDSPLVYNTTTGLNSNAVWDILVTDKGDVWIGTVDKGINRLTKENIDSFSLKSFTNEQGIPGNQIRSFLQDSEQNIWIGTSGNGLGMYIGDHFSHFTQKNGLPDNNVLAIAQQATGHYWIATANESITQLTFKNNLPVIKTYPLGNGVSVSSPSCIAVGKAQNKDIWIGTVSNGLFRFNGSKFQNYTEKDGLLSDRIYSLMVDEKGIVWIGTANGISRYDGVMFLNISTEQMQMQDEGVKTIIEDRKGNIWFGTSGGLARYSGDKKLRTFDEAEGLKHKDVNAIAEDKKGNIWIGTNSGGLYIFDISKNDTVAIKPVTNGNIVSSNSIRSLVFQDDNTLIAGTFQGFDKLTINSSGEIIKAVNYNSSDGFTGLECNDNAILRDIDGSIWLGTVNGLTHYTPALEDKKKSAPVVHIKNVQLFFKDVNWLQKSDSTYSWFNLPYNPELPYNENHLTFHFSALSYSNPDKVQYKYILEGSEQVWSPVSSKTEITFSGLGKGTYTFKVMAVNSKGNWSEPASFTFTIKAPWYQTPLFYVCSAIVLLILIYSFIKYREKKLIKEKKILEDIVVERTKEVVMQREHIAEKNREITDSINYAKRIQNAILPKVADIKQTFGDVFVLFKPKDIVSGDFYWMNAEHNLLAAADCTGHGVPGAFMSTIGVEKLNESLNNSTDPGAILSLVNRAVKKSLNQTEQADITEMASRDGMDIALIKLNKSGETATLKYAAANRPLWVLRNGSELVEEIKATKSAIGGLTDDNQQFEEHELKLVQGDTVYIFSDGFADQFSSNGKKLLAKKFRQLLIENKHLSLDEQKHYLNDFIENWKADSEQTDDILVIGLRV